MLIIFLHHFVGAAYGCLHCYRMEKNLLQQDIQRAALIFWAEADVIWSDDAVCQQNKLLGWLKSGVLENLVGEGRGLGKVHRFGGAMAKAGQSLVFGVGIHSQTGKDPVGLALDLYDANDKATPHFPLCIKASDCCILIIPDTTNSTVPSVSTLQEGTNIDIITEHIFQQKLCSTV